MPDLQKLSERLRRLRVRHGLTQEEFAEVAGVSYKFYQQIEAGRKKQIWLETVERLAAAFGLETWQILAPDEPAHTAISPIARSGRRRDKKPTSAASSRTKPELAAAEDPSPYGRRRTSKPPPSSRSGRS